MSDTWGNGKLGKSFYLGIHWGWYTLLLSLVSGLSHTPILPHTTRHAPLPYNESQMAFDYNNMYSGKLWMERNGEQRHVTDLNHEDALDYLQNHRAPDKKFCLTIAFFAPHAWDGKDYPDQYMAQDYTKDLYKDVVIPEPKTATAEAFRNLPYFIDEKNTARRRWKLRYPADVPDSYQVSMKRYYRMLSEIDDVVGSVIDELKTQGVYDNTLLVCIIQWKRNECAIKSVDLFSNPLHLHCYFVKDIYI